MARSRFALVAALAAAAAVGCQAVGPTGPASPRPSARAVRPSAPVLGPDASDLISKARLTGKVKLLSDLGAAIISNNTGGVISDQGLGVISDQGLGVISDQGTGLISKARYRTPYGLLAAEEATLADAVVEVLDAAGKPLLGADGKPITGKTDRTGVYAIDAALPAGRAAVLRVKLWNGGQLSALLPGAGGEKREQAIDTATSLGAAYVLDAFVAGRPDPQATLDKLPAAEATGLRAALDGLVTKPPAYQPAELVRLTTALRDQAPAVAERLEAIRALLLGQADLGAGRQANTVPLADPRATVPDGQGGFYVAEGVPGRIRQVAADGAITTWVDQLHGRIKENLFGIVDLARGADGSVYVAATVAGEVTRLAPDGTATRFAGAGAPGRGEPGGRADATAIYPLSLLADGDTLWIGEDQDPVGAPTRVLTVGPDGLAKEPVPGPAAWRGWRVVGLAKTGGGAGGAVYALLAADTEKGQIWRLPAGAAAWEQLPWSVETAMRSDLAAAEDGGLWLSEDAAGRVVHLAADGTRRVVSERAVTGIQRPSDVWPLPGGGVRVVDDHTARVYDLDAAGVATPVAGAAAGPASNDAIAFNGPLAAAYDPQGRLNVVEVGGFAVKRWADGALAPVAGSGVRGFAGDGGAATAARFTDPSNLAFRGDELIVLDRGNGRLRSVTGGTIGTLAGGGPVTTLRPGDMARPADLDLQTASGLAVGAGGRIFLSMLVNNQLLATAADGTYHPLASGLKGTTGDGGPLSDAQFNTPVGLVMGPDGALYVVDTGNMRVRRIPDPAAAAPTVEAFAGVDFTEALSRFSADPWPATTRAEAVFAFPGAACFDPAGNMYVAELGTLALPLLGRYAAGVRALPLALLPKVPPRIRKIAPDGTVTTVAGPGGKYFADTAAADALILPLGLTVDPQGRLVIVDPGANLIRILPAGTY